MVLGPTASVSPGNLLGLWVEPSNLWFNKPSRWFQCRLNVETHCCKLREELWIPSSLRASLWIFRGAEEPTPWELAPHFPLFLWHDFPLSSRLYWTTPPTCLQPPLPHPCRWRACPEDTSLKARFIQEKLLSSNPGCCSHLC